MQACRKKIEDYVTSSKIIGEELDNTFLQCLVQSTTWFLAPTPYTTIHASMLNIVQQDETPKDDSWIISMELQTTNLENPTIFTKMFLR